MKITNSKDFTMTSEFEEIITKRKKFNGKPFDHWQNQADELVVELIARAALHHTDPRSLIGYLARKRLMEIAKAESPDLLVRVLEDREACMTGFQRILEEIL